MTKAIFFDLDDTLYPYHDSNAKIQSEIEAISYFCKKYPRHKFLEALALYNTVKKDIKKRFACYPVRHNRELWFLEFLQKEKIFDKKIVQEMEELYWQHVLKNAQLYYDALLILPYLRKKYALGIITNGLKAVQEKKVHALGIASYFSVIATSSEAGFGKPHTDVFKLALRKAKVKPKDAAMVGDSPLFDIFPANKLHMTTIWLRRGRRYYYPVIGKTKPTHTITNFLELKKWF